MQGADGIAMMNTWSSSLRKLTLQLRSVEHLLSGLSFSESGGGRVKCDKRYAACLVHARHPSNKKILRIYIYIHRIESKGEQTKCSASFPILLLLYPQFVSPPIEQHSNHIIK